MGYCVESGFVHFYVKDTGLGIAKADIDKIFLRFQQADDSMTRKYGGTGLGLSISQSLVQLLGGTMKVKSEKNKGSEFSFRIPDEPCTSNKPSREAAGELLQEPAEMNATEKPVILVVEDEDSNYLYIKAVLMPRGYEIIRAAMALKAVELVNERDDIDLVLMDIQLPDYSGYEATRQIKALRPELPVIAQTAYAMADEKENSFAAGCDDYLSKPINKGKLLKMIRQYISG
ncbi:MAG: response regulator, partial [Bacteroidota bacterium]